jgi:hypothetical protein
VTGKAIPIAGRLPLVKRGFLDDDISEGVGGKKTRSTTMSFKGHVENGVVVFDEPATLPEGTVVEVVVREVVQADVPVGPSLWDRLKDVAGKANGLPPDASTRVDHYLTHGLPHR